MWYNPLHHCLQHRIGKCSPAKRQQCRKTVKMHVVVGPGAIKRLEEDESANAYNGIVCKVAGIVPYGAVNALEGATVEGKEGRALQRLVCLAAQAGGSNEHCGKAPDATRREH